jgi:citrate lyase beta subunit
MKYFNYLSKGKMNDIFYIEPGFYSRDTDIENLAYAVGACLYMPATRKGISNDIITKKYPQLKSIVICTEDAIGDGMVEESYLQIRKELNVIEDAIEQGLIQMDDIPLIFIRIRGASHVFDLYNVLEDKLEIVTGIVLPKVSMENIGEYFENIRIVNKKLKKCLYIMPIMESREIIYIESRERALAEFYKVFIENKDIILNIRLGGTDFSGYFGLRRSHDTCIYDLSVINDCISDILNTFIRSEAGFVVSGPVWEYFSSKRIFKPQIRVTPFMENFGDVGKELRKHILDDYMDGLIKEVDLDKSNGIIGKTVIHPSHIIPVQSMYVVEKEEYLDAVNILEADNNNFGAVKSQYKNKMNELKPHVFWAKKIIKRSQIYGVYNETKNFMFLLDGEN